MFGNQNSSKNYQMHLEIAKEENKTQEKEFDFMEELSPNMVGLKKTQKTCQQKEKESTKAWDHI